MPQCQFLFSAVFVFQKSYTGNILGDMGWPDLLSKLAVMVMMVIDNLVSPMISPR
jgi:hypothetical protein